MTSEQPTLDTILSPAWRSFFNYYLATILCWFGPYSNPQFAQQIGLNPDRGLVLGLILLAAVAYLKLGQQFRLSTEGITKIRRFPADQETLAWDEIQRFELRRGLVFSWLNLGNIAIIPRQAGRPEMLLPGISDPRAVITLMERSRQ